MICESCGDDMYLSSEDKYNRYWRCKNKNCYNFVCKKKLAKRKQHEPTAVEPRTITAYFKEKKKIQQVSERTDPFPKELI